MGSEPGTGSGVVIPHTKVSRPRLPRQHFVRERLLAAMDRAAERQVVSVAAPAGSGKSSMLSAWCRQVEGRETCWLSLDRDDNDPTRLLHGIVSAFRALDPGLGVTALEPSSTSMQGIRDAALPSLVNELAALGREAVLVVDDYHAIRSQEVHDSMAFLVTNLPENVCLVVASRHDPPLPLARLRLEGQLSEIRADDLALDSDETGALLEASLGRAPGSDQIDALQRRTEGWAAGVSLAGLWLERQPGASARIDEFAGDDHNVVEYLAAEILETLEPDIRTFLLETSLLERLEPDLCDAVRGSRDSAAHLAELDRRNLFVVPLDRRIHAYRYHQLFGEWLQREAGAASEVDQAALHRRAADWYRDNGELTAALRHAVRAGDVEDSTALLEAQIWPIATSGAWPDLLRLIDALPSALRSGDPLLEILEAWAAVFAGQPQRADPWISRALAARAEDPDGDHNRRAAYEAHAMRALAAINRADAAAVAENATALAELFPLIDPDADGLPISAYPESHSVFLLDPHLMAGTLAEQADVIDGALETADMARAGGLSVPYLLGMRALVEVGEGDVDRGLRTARAAVEMLHEHPGSNALEYLLALSVVAEHGHGDEAVRGLERMSRIVGATPEGAFPFAIYLIARGQFGVRAGDVEDAAGAIEEAESAIAAAPDPGPWLRGRLTDAKARLAAARTEAARSEDYGKPLSDREMSILRAFEGNLTQREIGQELYLSFNTVKTYSRSIFRKLGVSSRDDAVRAAKAAGLI